MKKLGWILVAVFVPCAVTVLSSPQLAPARPRHCDNPWVREPLVTYDLTGHTFAHEVHRHVTVYNDGLVTFADLTVPGDPAVAGRTFVTPAHALRLLADLDAVGAFELCDDPSAGGDIPLSTVTVFRARGPSPASGADFASHTFNYFDTMGAYAAVQAILDAFIEQHVPEL